MNHRPTSPSHVRERLERIDQAVDWSRFDKYLHWLQTDVALDQSYQPILLFKAMLILHWHALTAPEYDHAIDDSVTFRSFVGLKPDEVGPRHIAVSAFRRLLVDRGAAADLLSELRRQLSQQGILLPVNETAGAEGTVGDRELYPLASDVRLIRPPAWVSLERSFVDYWAKGCEGTELPSLALADPANAPDDLTPHLIVMRVLDDDFRFEFVGQAIASANQSDLVGAKISAKANRNIAAYGHAGIQDELLAVCRAAESRRQPVAASGYFLNAMGNRRNLWAVVAPVQDRQSGNQMLIGVALVVHVEKTSNQDWAISSARLPLLPGEIDPFSLDTDFRALGPPEWNAIEHAFLAYWHNQRGDRKAPLLSDIKLTDMAPLEPHLTLTRVLKDIGFQYELIGDHIQTANEGNATGQIVAEKREQNLQDYGHAGLQDELAGVFSRCVAGLRPVGTSTYYVNSGGARCQMWTMQAPLSDEYGEICMIIGVTLIKRLSVN